MLLRALLLLAAALSAIPARACSIPVFRYALDRWQADPFALEISATDAKDEAVARFLRNLTDSTPLNLAPSRSDAEGLSRLTFPHAAPDATPAWSGKLDGAALSHDHRFPGACGDRAAHPRGRMRRVGARRERPARG